MSLFAPAREQDAHPYWFPSEVRRRLVARRAGVASTLLREQNGADNRTAVGFSLRGTGGDTFHFEALSGDEAEAARDLFEALHAGDLDAFIHIGPTPQRIHPSYWEPRHDAASIHPSVLWGDDSIGNHPDRPVPPDYAGAVVLIPREPAAKWIDRLTTLAVVPADADPIRGTLPPNATHAAKRDEEFAHAAARLVRNGLKLSAAIREVAPEDPTREEDSISRGIRHSFKQMYDGNGRPMSVKN